MGKLVTPKVYLVGYTAIDGKGLEEYLKDSGNLDFLKSIKEAREQGLSEGEILCSFFAKLCYSSLTLGHNSNISRVRGIWGNLVGCFESGHLSVFENCQLNFVVKDCSRVFECELIRHRVGTAFSIESGRYVRGDEMDIVFDPILEPVKENIWRLQIQIEDAYKEMVKKMGLDDMKDFTLKKQITSALRRVMPEGKSKDLGFSVNLRALRHIVQLRTSRHAEYEIRDVFSQVYRLTKDRWPLLYYGAKEEEIKGIVEVSGMKCQPYQESEK